MSSEGKMTLFQKIERSISSIEKMKGGRGMYITNGYGLCWREMHWLMRDEVLQSKKEALDWEDDIYCYSA